MCRARAARRDLSSARAASPRLRAARARMPACWRGEQGATPRARPTAADPATTAHRRGAQRIMIIMTLSSSGLLAALIAPALSVAASRPRRSLARLYSYHGDDRESVPVGVGGGRLDALMRHCGRGARDQGHCVTERHRRVAASRRRDIIASACARSKYPPSRTRQHIIIGFISPASAECSR